MHTEPVAKPGRDRARPSHKYTNAVLNRQPGRDALRRVRTREGFAIGSTHTFIFWHASLETKHPSIATGSSCSCLLRYTLTAFSSLMPVHGRVLPPNTPSFAAKYIHIWRQTDQRWRQNRCLHRRSKERPPAEQGAYTVGIRNLHSTSERLVLAAQAAYTHGEKRLGCICLREML